MSRPDDRIRAGLDRLVQPADPSGAFDRVARRRRRYRARRRAGSALLSIAVVGGAIGGFLGLRGVFEPSVDPGSGLGPTPGPTATATFEPGEELTFWEICADSPFPNCQWVANVLDRAGFSPRHNTGSALVGRKQGAPPVTTWATGSNHDASSEPAPSDGKDCRSPYRALAEVEGIQVCTDGVRHVWPAQEFLVWVTSGQTAGDPLIGADELRPLVRASMSVDAADPSDPEPSTEILGGGVFGGFCFDVCDSRIVLSGGSVEILHTERCAPVAPGGVTKDSCDPPIIANTGRLTAQGDSLLAQLTSALDAALRPEHDVLQSHGTSRIPTDGADAWIALRRGEVRSTHIFGVFDKPPRHFRIADRFIGELISASWDCDDTDLVRFGRDCEPVVR